MGAMTLGSELAKLAASRISLKGYHGAVTSWLSKTESSPQRGRHARKVGCRRTGRIVPSNLVGKPRQRYQLVASKSLRRARLEFTKLAVFTEQPCREATAP